MVRNRLQHETSPYLLQHASNPVDWFPWGEEALERARTQDKPILLSIGYAACHWCHVMERESFEDPETAALMNERFVSIKVDREERPDLDAIYMDAVQAMTGQRGLAADRVPDARRRPFFAGTYFPDGDRHGLPSFRKVLAAIADVWEHRRAEAETQSAKVDGGDRTDGAARGVGGAAHRGGPARGVRRVARGVRPALGRVRPGAEVPAADDAGVLPADAPAGHAGRARARHDDARPDGRRRDVRPARRRVPSLLDRRTMARPALREDALRQRAPRSACTCTHGRSQRNERYRTVATQTCDYLLRELRHPQGGFFSSQDADSEGVEGRFFVWSWDELVEVGGEAVATAFGATPGGNWEGTNVLWRPLPLDAVAAELELEPDDLARDLETARSRLFELRDGRVHPATDDKVLAAWNGMAIAALAEAGRAFGDAAYVDAAVRAAEFVLEHLRDGSGRLLRSWRDGRSGRPAFADDHASMADACLVLYETTFELRWFEHARSLADELVRRFRDPERGGFFQTGDDAEALVVRPKDLSDNAVPSGNSAAAEVLLRLAHLTGEPAYERAGVDALRLVRDAMAGAPSGFGHALGALEAYLSPVKEVAIVGDLASEQTRALVAEITARRFLPNHVLAVASPGDDASAAAVALLRDRPQHDGRATAYVCERFVCKLPVTDPAELVSQVTAAGEA